MVLICCCIYIHKLYCQLLDSQVQWSDGRTSWVKYTNLPIKVREILESGKEYKQEGIEVQEFGQLRKQWQIHGDSNKEPVETNTFVR